MMAGYKFATIKRILALKSEDFLKSIDDDLLRAEVRKDMIITGGSIAHLILGEKVNDYDVYFKSYTTAYNVAKYYVDKFNNLENKPKWLKGIPIVKEEFRDNIKGETEKRIIIFIKSNGVAGEKEDEDEIDIEAGIPIKHKSKYTPIFLSDNAITLSDKMQIIIRFCGSPEEIHKNFDFVHCTGYFDVYNHELHVSKEAMQSLLAKNLIYNGSLYPITSVFRLRKFIDRGWNISAGQILKILFQISKIDLSDTKILKEQLVGVDTAFMFALIKELEKVEGQVEETHLAELIDKIFE